MVHQFTKKWLLYKALCLYNYSCPPLIVIDQVIVTSHHNKGDKLNNFTAQVYSLNLESHFF
mgnify:CR=1 FL=1